MPVFQLPEEILFPDPALAESDGLLAVGGDLSIDRLICAYSNGIFPWYSENDPILWWSPDPRLILFPDRFRLSRSLSQKIKKNCFNVKWDTAFNEVINLCAGGERAEQEGTWLTREMKEAYINLHQKGFAHSVEAFFEGELVGGLYGVSLGNAFFGESMFHHKTDASKVALYHLVEKAKNFKFLFIDSQIETKHMITMGAELIRRKKYLLLLDEAIRNPTRKGKWK
jgi:leucyl/phenylalanyl-tRNA---protein transferase